MNKARVERAIESGRKTSVKRNILEWIGNAKTTSTRDKRIDETASRAAVNERANQWRTSRSALN